jgi:NADH-quinone oxidoreductase subunit N
MEGVVLKSFSPELFLSFGILFQIIFNIGLVNNLKYNFPLIEKEVLTQTLFLLCCLLWFYHGLQLEGFLCTFTLLNNFGAQGAKFVLVFICLFMVFIVYESHKMQKLNFFEFYSFFLIALLGLLLMISASDFLSFYLCMEIQALCFYVLAAFNRRSIFSIEAGLKYFVSGAFISGFYLLGVSFIYGSLGTINLNDLYLLLSFDLNSYNVFTDYTVFIGIVFITCTILFKIACAPFHFWASDVYEGSPLSSTITFAVLPKISLFFFLFKWLHAINVFSSNIATTLLVCGLFSAFIGTFFAISQKRFKRLIIYSSIGQTGFLVAGASCNTLESYTIVLFFLLIYLVTSVLIWGHFILFYSASQNTAGNHSKLVDSLFVSSLSNLYPSNVLWCFSLVIIFFSVAGIPPFTGFISKMLIAYSLVINNCILSSIILMIIGSISAYYYIRVIKTIFFETKSLTPTFNRSIKVMQGFRIVYNNEILSIIYFVFALFMMFLIILFYFPGCTLVLCQYLAISSFLL